MDIGKRFRGNNQEPEEMMLPQQQYSQPHETPPNDLPDVLSVLRISPHIPVPEELLTSNELSHVQFRVSQPEGYLHSDVEDFHSTVKKTISWYQSTLHEREADITRLANEYDRMQTDLQNVKYEREFTEIDAADKVPRADYNALLARVAELEAAGGAGPMSDEERQAFTELQQWADQVEPAYEKLEAELAEAHALIQSLQNSDGESVPMSDEERQAFNELQQWADQVQPAYEKLEAERDELKASIENIQSSSPIVDGPMSDEERQAFNELQQWADQVEPAYEKLEAELAEAHALIQSLQNSDGVIATDDSESAMLLEAAHKALAEAEEQKEEYRIYAQELDEYLDKVTPIIEAYAEAEDVDNKENNDTAPEGDFSSDSKYEDNSNDSDDAGVVITPFVGQERPDKPTVARTDETPNESFARILQEMRNDASSDAPELGSDIRFESAEEAEEEVKPGSPLKSLLPGEKIEDFL